MTKKIIKMKMIKFIFRFLKAVKATYQNSNYRGKKVMNSILLFIVRVIKGVIEMIKSVIKKL